MTSEAEFIAMMRALAPHNGARGLLDDAALLKVGGETLVLTHDMMVEGRHWRAGSSAAPGDPVPADPASTDPADVAWKLVAVNLSDLAAKGAEPLGLLLGFMLGDDEWDARFAEGLKQILAAFDVPLLGGDTVGGVPGGGPRSLGLTAIGRATSDPVPSRAGARAGDALFVTDAVGDAMAGYDLGPASREYPALHAAFHRPRPLLDAGRALAPQVHAMMDVSDGLLLDASRMAGASGLSLKIDSASVPCSDAFGYWLTTFTEQEREQKLRARLRWGDDYALLFAAQPDFVPPIAATRIGVFGKSGSGVIQLDGKLLDDGEQLGYQH